MREALGPFALPSAGTDEFLDKLVGWWERRAVDLLLRRRSAVTREEVVEEVVRLRDQYGERTLPAPDPALAVELSQVLLQAYASAPFVEQLQLIAMRDERVQLAVRDYHRAYAQRSRWLEQGVLAPDELLEWEDRLYDEWEHAWQRMLDGLAETSDEPTQASAGKELYGEMEQSSLNPLRDGRDRFLYVGTLNGIAERAVSGGTRTSRRVCSDSSARSSWPPAPTTHSDGHRGPREPRRRRRNSGVRTSARHRRAGIVQPRVCRGPHRSRG